MADDVTPETLLVALVREKEEFEALVRVFLASDAEPRETLSLRLPNLTPPELGFIQAVAWLYGLYFEVARTHTSFVLGKFDAFGLDPDRAARAHRKRVGRLRTYLQHNLDFTKSHDRETQVACEQWFQEVCGTSVPREDAHWRLCLSALLGEGSRLLTCLGNAIRFLEADESREEIRKEWVQRVRRYHGPEEFDAVIAVTAADMGRENLDVVALRRRYYERWVAALRVLHDGYLFEHEARRLIEHSILTEGSPGLPITGAEVMTFFEIEPGPQIGQILRCAQRLYDDAPCSAAELLDRVRSECPPAAIS